jgi:hypothetical protein
VAGVVACRLGRFTYGVGRSFGGPRRNSALISPLGELLETTLDASAPLRAVFDGFGG